MQRILTYVEHRASCNSTLKSLQDSTEKLNWDLNIVDYISPWSVDEGSFISRFSDFVFWRALNIPSYQEAQRVRLALLQKEVIGVNMNPTGGMSSTSDKFFQHGTLMYPGLEKHKLPIYLAGSKTNVKALIEAGKLKFPFVIKPNMGTLGKGIVLCQNMDELDKYNEDLRFSSVQPYVDSDHSWRVFVMGGVGVGAMKKYGDADNPGDFEAKCSGSTRVPEEDKETEEQLCYLAAKATVAAGLEYSGIDLIRDSKDGNIYVLENNVVASWIGGFRQVVGINMAEELIHWFEDRGMYKENSKYECMDRYLSNRMKYLSRKKQESCEKILSFEEKLPEGKWYDHTLAGKIKQVYSDISRGKYDKKIIHELIEEVEDRTKFEFCGNFIGGDILEDACETTARYIAICKKAMQ